VILQSSYEVLWELWKWAVRRRRCDALPDQGDADRASLQSDNMHVGPKK